MGLAQDEDASQAVVHEVGQEAAGVLAEPSGRPQADPVVQRRAVPPQPGGGEEGQRGHRVDGGEFECHPAAERVAGDVGGRDAELAEEARDGRGQGRRERFDLRGHGLGVAEARKVDGDDVEVPGESGDDGIPGAARQPDPVQ